MNPSSAQLRTTAPQPLVAPSQPQSRKRRVGIFVALAVAIAAIVAVGLFVRARSASPATQPAGPRPVPVVSAPVTSGNIALYLSGLGTVTPYSTVTVRSRVDGELVNVAFREGQEVKEGDLLAEIDPRPFAVQLSQAEAQLARNEALLRNAKVDLERYQSAGQSATRQEVDNAASLVTQYEATLKSDRASIDSAKLQLTYSKITSPITGRVGLRLVDRGNIVRSTEATGIAVITQLRPITIVFSVPQADLPRVIAAPNRGDGLLAEAWNRDFTTRLAVGKLLAIDNQIDSTTGTVKLKAVFANENGSLFPNQFVNVRLNVENRSDALTVPLAAIQRGPDGTFAYVVASDETAQVRPIKVGLAEGDRVIIESGLASGEVVVTDGVDKLQPGTKVAVRKPATARATSQPATTPSTRSPEAAR